MKYMKGILGLLILLLIFASSPLQAAEPTAYDYSNNIGFMKDVPKDLQDAFPMCDEFLDVKWIREMPGGGWVGKVLIDMYEYDKINQRELIVLAGSRKFDIFDVSMAKYKAKELEDLIKSADKVSGIYWDDDVMLDGLTVLKNKEQIVVSKKYGVPSGAVKQGFPARSFTHFTQDVCLTRSQGDGGWVVENEMPFVLDRMSALEKEKYEQFKRLSDMECLQLMKEMNELDNTVSAACGNLTGKKRDISKIDADDDGRMDYRFFLRRFGLAFLNDEKPFLMPWPEACSNYRYNPSYYNRNGKQKEEQCVAREKTQYLQNRKSE